MNRMAMPTRRSLPALGFLTAISAPILFLVFAFLLGGSSRSDVASIPFLRAAAVLFGFWAITQMRNENLRRIWVPLLLLLAAAVWTAIQLMPLPPTLWHALPGRETIVEIDRLLGQEGMWRPISLAPSQTWNSLLAMTVPFAALLLVARLEPEDQSRLLFTIVGIAGISALLGFVQLLSDIGGAAYLYRITNTGSMVGLFANRNHHALFQACAILIACMLLRDEMMRRRQRKQIRLGLIFAIVLCTAMTALVGSRGGFVAGVVAFAAGYAMIMPAWHSGLGDRRQGRTSAASARFSQLPAYSPPVLLAALFGTVIWFSTRTTAINRVADENAVDDMRFRAWPTVRDMMETYWTTGSGMGSFADVFRVFEPDSLLRPAYFNHAHNDWAELVLTGGLPFLLILLAALIWFGRKFAALGSRNLVKGYRGDYRLAVLVIILLLAAGSAVDYPLRVPSLQVMAIMLITLVCCHSPASGRRD